MAIDITDKQLEQLELCAFKNYITELVEHCQGSFPWLLESMSEDELSQVLRLAIQKANDSGFDQRGPVQFYIDMLVVCGWGFETDPQYPWIAEYFAKHPEQTQIEKSTYLYYEVMDYLRCTRGKENDLWASMISQFNEMKLDQLLIKSSSYLSDIETLFRTMSLKKYTLLHGEVDFVVLLTKWRQYVSHQWFKNCRTS